MRIPLSWIQRFLHIDKSPEEIADLLTLAGVEVEKIERLKVNFEGVIVALVKEVFPHENADKLRVATINDGEKDYQVVCGAPVLTKGKKVAFAQIGAILDTDTDAPFTLKKAKIRGVESKGMLCTEKELGIGKNADGLLYLDDSAPLGEDFAAYYLDPTFDVTLTPNLGHCRSIFGICRELSRYTESTLAHPSISIEQSTTKSTEDLISVDVKEQHICSSYAARVVTGIEVSDSPLWMKDLLIKSGLTPINNVVDITNYVQHELGQPLHAYDYTKLENGEIVVRKARNNETIETLDGKNRTLSSEDLVIASGDKPCAIAGIIGGEDSSVNKSTHTVVLESANFCSSQIRKSSRNLKVRTESSSRFENQIDSASVTTSLDYACFLLQEIAGGSVSKDTIHVCAHPFRPRFLTARLSRINNVLGTTLSLNEVESILVSLGFTATTDDDNVLQLKIPSWRNDVSEEIDVIEEVARVYGYNNIKNDHPKHISSTYPNHPLYTLEKHLRRKLSQYGLQEFLTCSLISEKMADMDISHGLFEVTPVKVLHAKSVDQSILRPSMLPGLLHSMLHNKNNGNHTIKAFELGRIFSKRKDTFQENFALGILLSGEENPHHFDRKDDELDFFHMKGILEMLFADLSIHEIQFKKSNHKTFHPNIQADIEVCGCKVATFGKIHPNITANLKLHEETFFAEADLLSIEKYRKETKTFTAISSIPSSTRDQTFTMHKDKELANIFSLISSASIKDLCKCELRDIYHDPEKSPEQKNVTFRFVYRGKDKTLTDEQIQESHDQLVSIIEKA